jgi:MFS family permease
MPGPPAARDRAVTTGRARAWAVAVVFVANGLGGPSFLPRLPERQADLGLSDAGLGVVLTGMAAGALVASPAAGRAVGRFGSRRVVVASSLTLAASLWTTGAAPTPAVLFLALVLVGAADGAMDIAMNANGAAYERRAGASVMHRLHGAWSLGALAAAGLAAGSAALGVPLSWHLAGVGAVVAVAVGTSRPRLATGDALTARAASPADEAIGAATGPAGERAATAAAPGRTAHERRARGRRGGRALAVLAAATVGGALVEGAPADWSAVRLERMGTGAGTAALGLAAFMAGMLAGRLVGDRLTDRFGGPRVLRAGMALVAVGLLAGALAEHPAVFAIGLVLAGAGSSGFFPLAFSAGANTAGVPPGVGAATVSLAARLGFLVEPLIVGALANAVGLRWAFALVGVVAVLLAAGAPRIVPATAAVARAPAEMPA